MKNHIPTIEVLQGKPVSELRVIFRKAAEIANNDHRPEAERHAAIRTIENVKRAILSKDLKPWI